VHNVYLSVVLNAGWLRGGVYWILVGLTAVLGFRHSLKSTPTQPLFLIVYAAFIANAMEGFIIDSDHWRHFYLLAAMVWGLMSVRTSSQRPRQRGIRRGHAVPPNCVERLPSRRGADAARRALARLPR